MQSIKPIIDGKFWQFIRPNGYVLGSSYLTSPRQSDIDENELAFNEIYDPGENEEFKTWIERDINVFTEDRFKPTNGFFLKALDYTEDFNKYLNEPAWVNLQMMRHPDDYYFNRVKDFVNQYGLLAPEDKCLNDDKYIENHMKFFLEVERFIVLIQKGMDYKDFNALSRLANKYISDTLDVIFSPSTPKENIKINLVPKTLYAHMVLNLVKFAKGELNFKECEYSKCDKWFEVPVSHKGQPQRYCSTSHRNMASRERTSS